MSNPQYQNNEGYDSGCRLTDDILRRSAEEIRAEVARVAPHWRRYSEEREARRRESFGKTDCWCAPNEFCGQCDPKAYRHYREAWEGDALTDARRTLALEKARLEMPKYVLNPDGTMEVYSLEVHGPLRKCHLVKPERNTSLLTNTPAGRIHAATLSGNKSRIEAAWEKYGTVVKHSYIARNRPSLWRRFCNWLGWQRTYICRWLRNLFTS